MVHKTLKFFEVDFWTKLLLFLILVENAPALQIIFREAYIYDFKKFEHALCLRFLMMELKTLRSFLMRIYVYLFHIKILIYFNML